MVVRFKPQILLRVVAYLISISIAFTMLIIYICLCFEKWIWLAFGWFFQCWKKPFIKRCMQMVRFFLNATELHLHSELLFSKYLIKSNRLRSGSCFKWRPKSITHLPIQSNSLQWRVPSVFEAPIEGDQHLKRNQYSCLQFIFISRLQIISIHFQTQFDLFSTEYSEEHSKWVGNSTLFKFNLCRKVKWLFPK